MNPKYFTLQWWSIYIWFFLWGLWSVPVVSLALYSMINVVLLILGFILMFYCAKQEEIWFPRSDEKETTK